MKKLFFAALMLFSAGSVMAQIQFESGSLKDALAKAKAENKLVMAIGSATWCGPCQAAAKTIYPLAEVGEFMNGKFVSLKYELDKADPDMIAKTYGLKAYPTYFFLDGDGKEVARMIGGSKDGADFVARVTNATAKENQWEARKARFKSDPSYAIEHIKYLNSVYYTKEAADALNELFAKRTVKENFSKESVELYKSIITSMDNAILKSMLENKKEVAATMGKTEYSTFLKDITTNILFNNGSFSKAETLDSQLAFIKANPEMNSGMAQLVAVAKDKIVAKDGAGVATEAVKISKNFSSLENDMIIWYVMRNLKKDAPKDDLIALVNSAIKAEKDPKKVEGYKKTLSTLAPSAK